jgi:hypothetical protein
MELRPSGIDKSSSARAILGDYGVNTGTISGSAENPQKRDSTASIRSKKSIERYQLLPETGIDFILLSAAPGLLNHERAFSLLSLGNYQASRPCVISRPLGVP